MRIAFAIKSLTPAGGAERVLSEVASGLAGRGHDVTVLSYDRAADAPFYPLDGRVTRVPLGIGATERASSVGETLTRMRSLRRRLVELRPDVAIGFMHSTYIPLGLAMTGSGIPVIASEHIDFEYYRNRPLHALLLRSVPFHADAITCLSEPVRRGFPRPLARRMTVMPNPVAMDAAAMADVAGEGRRKLLLAVGRLAEQKDHATLIEAFGRIAGRCPDWDLRIIGEGELRPALTARIATLGLEDRVQLPGTTRDIGAEYRQAQLFAMPSRFESFGLATAEALAHGLPAIGFADCAGTNELIVSGSNGLLVGSADRVSALAEGLEALMGSPEMRRRMADAAPASVTQFTPERVVDRWEQLIGQVADSRPGR